MCEYDINVFYSEDDEGYIADIPELKYCSAYGKTREKAIEEVLLALDAWLAAARETGRKIPLPKRHLIKSKIA